MTTSNIRVYADTSVYGGVFDEEFTHASKIFFENVQKHRFKLVVSEVVRRELALAPANVQTLANELLPHSEFLQVSGATIALQQAYIKQQIVTKKSEADAFHVALATAGQCSIIVSWNCKHIVHFQKVPLYNAVSVRMGYAPIQILTPMEVAYASDS